MSDILVAYGSSRGGAMAQAKKVAELLGVEARPLNEVTESMLMKFSKAIFCVSTTGNGQYPMNCFSFAQNFEYSSLNISHLKFAMLALGSSYYEHYCKAAILIYDMLVKHGATPMFPLAKSDKAATDYGESVIAGFIQSVETSFSVLAKKVSDIPFTIKRNIQDPKIGTSPLEPSGYQYAKITKKEVLSKDGYTPAMHRYTLELPPNVKYVAGDHFDLLPMNDPENVDAVLRLLKLNPDEVITIEFKGETIIPPKLTIRQLFSQYLDLHCHPTKEIVELFETKITIEKDTSVFDVIVQTSLQIFPDLEKIISAMSLISPRTYSASSEKEGVVDLIIGDIYFGVDRPGMTTHYLSLPATNVVAINHQEGLFQYPTDESSPMIIIALGSGVSPIFSILEHRAKLDKSKQGKLILFMGSRVNASIEKIISELQHYKDTGVINELFIAISREGKKEHVNDLMIANSQLIWTEWQNLKAQFYYCGPPNAVDEFREIMNKFACKLGNMRRNEAVHFTTKHIWNIESF